MSTQIILTHKSHPLDDDQTSGSHTRILCPIIPIKSYTTIKDTIQKAEFINTTLSMS